MLPLILPPYVDYRFRAEHVTTTSHIITPYFAEASLSCSHYVHATFQPPTPYHYHAATIYVTPCLFTPCILPMRRQHNIRRCRLMMSHYRFRYTAIFATIRHADAMAIGYYATCQMSVSPFRQFTRLFDTNAFHYYEPPTSLAAAINIFHAP